MPAPRPHLSCLPLGHRATRTPGDGASGAASNLSTPQPEWFETLVNATNLVPSAENVPSCDFRPLNLSIQTRHLH